MFSILIADDEQIIRQGLAARLEFLHIFPDTLYEAADGKEALHIIRQKQPDIVVTDIRMPALDGLSLIKTIKPDFPDIEFIILTGYAEFDYAKRAMEFGVHSYILKPISNKELEIALLKSIEKLKSGRIKKRMEIEHLFLQCIQSDEKNDIFKQKLEKAIGTSPDDYKIVCVLASHKAYPFSAPDNEMLSELFENCRRSYVHIEDIAFFCFRDLTQAGQYVLIFYSHVSAGFTDTAAGILQRGLTELQPAYPALFAGMSETGKHIYGDLYLHALEAYKQSFFIDKPAQKRLFFYPAQHIKRPPKHFVLSGLQNAIHRADDKDIEKQLYALLNIGHVFDGTFSDIRALWVSIMQLLVKETKKAEENTACFALNMAFPFDKYTNFLSRKDFALYIKKYIITFLRKNGCISDNENKEDRSIKSAADYVRSHYTENLHINNMAYRYAFSPNYFSYLFKKETGCSFVKYIIKLRIEYACTLFKHTDLSVQQVAQKTGYTDSQYFFRVFKKNTGLTPSEYRKKMQRQTLL